MICYFTTIFVILQQFLLFYNKNYDILFIANYVNYI